uniref:Uncharacterized protein n=1 Tax=Onchocerca volvulus TaxID=6282 RepID=A0A8R1TXR8_ONCVO
MSTKLDFCTRDWHESDDIALLMMSSGNQNTLLASNVIVIVEFGTQVVTLTGSACQSTHQRDANKILFQNKIPINIVALCLMLGST